MSREEDLIRSTTRAIASSVRDVPPLRLEPDADEPRSRARSPRRRRAGGSRRWRTWGAPLTAAALVIALAVALVTVRSMQNEGVAPPKPANSADSAGAPRYYVGLTQFAGAYGTAQDGIVVGDSVTGQRIAKFAPPARTTFQSVTAAADDRTFAVLAVTSSTGSFAVSRPEDEGRLTGRWYEVKLAPGTARPARLIPLPIKPWSWTFDLRGTPGQVFATALSPDGRELAVADTPPARAGQPAQDGQEVKVFSIATGRLLHEWSQRDSAPPFADDDWERPSLSWVDGNAALMLVTGGYDSAAGSATGTVRRLSVTGPSAVGLASRVTWTGNLPPLYARSCYTAGPWPPLISPDGRSLTCVIYQQPAADPSNQATSIVTDPLPGGAGASPRSVYRVPGNGAEAAALWVSASGGAFIAQWYFSHTRHAALVSRGRVTPLRLPADLATAQPGQIAF